MPEILTAFKRHTFTVNGIRNEKTQNFSMIEMPTQGMAMGECTVSQELWQVVAESLPRRVIDLCPSPSKNIGKQGAQLPVDSINWYEAIEFCSRLSIYLKQTIFLPSEEQWLFAAATSPAEQINFMSIAPQPVNLFEPNEMGVRGMLGNIWEFTRTCASEEEDFEDKSLNDRITKVIAKGGSYQETLSQCESTSRAIVCANTKDEAVGFRLMMVI